MITYWNIVIWFLFCLMAFRSYGQDSLNRSTFRHSIIRYGGLERADTTAKIIYLVFTGGDYNDGGKRVKRYLRKKDIPAHFFFTGDFYRAQENKKLIKNLRKQGHYLGPHSDKHLLYATWEDRNALLVSKEEFTSDLLKNYEAMSAFGISRKEASLFVPPYEWYNQQISNWTAELGLYLVNFSPGTRSNADYTTPDMGDKYISSNQIYEHIIKYESTSSCGLNGFILLVHIGTHPNRTDKFYNKLPQLIDELKVMGYRFGLLTELL